MFDIKVKTKQLLIFLKISLWFNTVITILFFTNRLMIITLFKFGNGYLIILNENSKAQ